MAGSKKLVTADGREIVVGSCGSGETVLILLAGEVGFSEAVVVARESVPDLVRQLVAAAMAAERNAAAELKAW